MLDALRQVVDGAEDVTDVRHGLDGVRASWPLLPTTLECGAGAARVRLPAFVDVNYDVFSVSRRGFWVAGRAQNAIFFCI